MNHRLMIFLFVMTSLVCLLVGFWWMVLHFLAFSVVDRIVGLAVVTAGWYIVTLLAVRWLASWRKGRGRSFLGRAAQSMEIMTVRCEVCDGYEFLEGPHGGLCTNIKCVVCSAEYNYGPGIMERIHRN